MRTSSSQYQLDNTQDYLKHLTNNCFQVLSDQYGIHEDGNIISLEELENYIKETKCREYSLDEHFFPYAASLAVDVILSAAKRMKPTAACFELFGLDLLIDEDLRIWLLECNVNPHLGQPNAYMKKNVPNMINEMLTLTIDHMFPPKIDQSTELEKKNWVMIYDGTYRRREHTLVDKLYPIHKYDLTPVPEPIPKQSEDDSPGKSRSHSRRPNVNKSFTLYISPNANSTANSRKPRLFQTIAKQEGQTPSSQQVKQKKITSELEEDFDQLEEEICTIKMSEEEGKKSVSLCFEDKIESNSTKPKVVFSVDLVQEIVLKLFKDPGTSLHELLKSVDRIFEILAHPKCYNENSIMRALKTVESLIESQYETILLSQKHIKTLLDILHCTMSASLMLAVFETVEKTIKPNLASPISNHISEFIELLGRFLLLSMSDKDLSNSTSRLCVILFKSINKIVGSGMKNIYLPGKSTEVELIRNIFVLCGVPVLLVFIHKAPSLPEKISSLAEKILYTSFDLDNLILQREIFDLFPIGVYEQSTSIVSLDLLAGFGCYKMLPMLGKLMVQKAVKQFNKEMQTLFCCEESLKEREENGRGSPKTQGKVKQGGTGAGKISEDNNHSQKDAMRQEEEEGTNDNNISRRLQEEVNETVKHDPPILIGNRIVGHEFFCGKLVVIEILNEVSVFFEKEKKRGLLNREAASKKTKYSCFNPAI